jgi:hypothetical protein
MPTMGVKRQKFGVFTLVMLMGIGAGFTLLGIPLVKSNKIDPSWTRVTGTVIRVNAVNGSSGTTYAPVVQYSAGGQKYEVANNFSTSSYPSLGSTRQVAYDPAQPQHSKVVGGIASNVLVYIFPAVGVAMLIGGPVLFIRSLARSKDIHSLKSTGQKVQGVITDVQSLGGNNSSYRIVVSANDAAGQVRNYTSDVVYGIGGLSLFDYRSNPVPMDVYVNPANPGDYYVDVSEVPGLTPERIQQLIASATHPGMPAAPAGQPPAATPPFQPAAPQVPVPPAYSPEPQVPPQPPQGQ